MLNKTLVCCLFMMSFVLLLHKDAFCDINSLQGIKSVSVRVILSGEKDGVSGYQLRNDVELRLRRAGIEVDPNSPYALVASVAIMDMYRNAATNIIGRYGIVALTMEQEVRPKRNPRLPISAPAWQSYVKYLQAGPNGLGNRCRNVVLDFTDKFIKDYLSANSK